MSTSTASLLSGGPPDKDEGYSTEAALHQCMEDFARALHQTPPDLRGMMHAFRGAVDCLDCEEEGE